MHFKFKNTYLWASVRLSNWQSILNMIEVYAVYNMNEQVLAIFVPHVSHK